MFCIKCGEPISDDRTICEQCEAIELKAQADFVQDNVITPPTDPVEAITSANTFELNTEGVFKPKKSRKGWIIGIASAAVIAVVALVLGIFWKDFFPPYDTPEEHLAYVEEDTKDAFVDGLTGTYGKLLGKSEATAGGVSCEMHVLLGDEALDMISDLAGIDLDWISDIMLKVDSSSSGSKGKAAMSLGLGDTAVVTLDYVMDLEEGMFYIGIPELSKTYFEIDLEDIMEDVYGESGAMSMSTLMLDTDTLSEIAELLPSEQVLNSLLNRYIDILFDQFADVEDESETIKVNGVSQKCTALTICVDQEMIINAIVKILETAKTDSQLIDTILNVANSDYVDADLDEDDIVEVIDELLSEIEDAMDEMDDNMDLFELTDYVDSDDNIIGRRIEIEGVDEEIYYMTATSNGKFGFEACFGEMLEITGSGTDKKGVITGEYVIEVQGEEYLTIEVEEFNKKSMQQGNLVGTVRLIPNEELIANLLGVRVSPDVALEMIFNNTDNKFDSQINVLLNGDVFVGITLDATMTGASKVAIPSDTVDMMDEDEMIDWVSDIDFDIILDNLDDAGIPSRYINFIEDALDQLEDSI